MTVDELKALMQASPTDIIEIFETVSVQNGNHLDLDGKFIDSHADPAFAIAGNRWSIRNGRIRARAGVCIDFVGLTHMGLVSGMYLTSLPEDKEVVRCVAPGQCYDTLFQACELENPPNMTAPVVRVSVDGGLYNSNSWQNIRFQTNGSPQVPCVILECNSDQAWIYGNSFRDINGESTNAGLIHCKTCYGTVLDNIIAYDCDGIISDDMILFSKNCNLPCSNTTIRSYARLAGELAEGKYDINMEHHYTFGMLLEQLSGTSKRLRVKCPPPATRIEVQDFVDPWLNST